MCVCVCVRASVSVDERRKRKKQKRKLFDMICQINDPMRNEETNSPSRRRRCCCCCLFIFLFQFALNPLFFSSSSDQWIVPHTRTHVQGG